MVDCYWTSQFYHKPVRSCFILTKKKARIYEGCGVSQTPSQYYKCEDSRDEDFGSLPIEGSYGIDYLIGEEACLGKGLGKEMVTSLVDLVFSFPDAKRVTADIDKENKASERTLLSCGFTLFDVECSRYVLTHKSNNITE